MVCILVLGWCGNGTSKINVTLPDLGNRSRSSIIMDDNEQELQGRRELLLQCANLVVNVVGSAAVMYALPLYDKIPYHTSALSGEAWVHELLNGHPERIRNELGVHKHVFDGLIFALITAGLGPFQHLLLEEQLAIFLYTCVTGLSLRHVSERLQRANVTISKYVPVYVSIMLAHNLHSIRYFINMLIFFSSAPFYNRYVHLPLIGAPTPPEILNNPKFYPFFKDALRAINGTHINCSATAAMQQAVYDRKGGVT